MPLLGNSTGVTPRDFIHCTSRTTAHCGGMGLFAAAVCGSRSLVPPRLCIARVRRPGELAGGMGAQQRLRQPCSAEFSPRLGRGWIGMTWPKRYRGRAQVLDGAFCRLTGSTGDTEA